MAELVVDDFGAADGTHQWVFEIRSGSKWAIGPPSRVFSTSGRYVFW